MDYVCFIPSHSLHRIIHCDKAEVIHKQENRITAEMEQLVMITTEKQANHEPDVPPYRTIEKQLKYSSNRYVF
jgi:hypothetical protein